MNKTITVQVSIEPILAVLREALKEADPNAFHTSDTAPADATGEFVPEEEAQEYLGSVSKSTMRRARKAGLPFAKVGKRCYYRMSDLDRWLESHAR